MLEFNIPVLLQSTGLFAIFALDSNNNGTMSYVIKDLGYTLHEHYDNFGLINMNGTVYNTVPSTFPTFWIIRIEE